MKRFFRIVEITFSLYWFLTAGTRHRHDVSQLKSVIKWNLPTFVWQQRCYLYCCLSTCFKLWRALYIYYVVGKPLFPPKNEWIFSHLLGCFQFVDLACGHFGNENKTFQSFIHLLLFDRVFYLILFHTHSKSISIIAICLSVVQYEIAIFVYQSIQLYYRIFFFKKEVKMCPPIVYIARG